MKRYVVILLLVCYSCILFAQDPASDRVALRAISQREMVKENEARARVESWLRLHPQPRKFTDRDGNTIELVDIADNLPVYKTTFNDGAAVTTGAKVLLPNGSTGLNLTGSGITVGVWDSGPVYQHAEFDTRAQVIDFATVSDHATHVSGTLIAKGLNSAARGMAPGARLKSYDWNSDLVEMSAATAPDTSGLLFSNHSYGLLHGWYQDDNDKSAWAGNPGISTIEDYRFGYYSALTRAIDDIAYHAPYYSIFWAVGNDRGDANINNGSAVFPADCNSGTGYDCIVTEGVAKNIITVGSIAKVPFTGAPISVSSFSNWGPTDDGRIKPDLVAAGEALFSTLPTPTGQSENAYGTSSGTSMATPSAAGSLMLLQQLYKKNTGQYLRAASLKALAVHTATEAGDFAGPDYRHGWGLLNVEKGAEVLNQLSSGSSILAEESIAQGEVKSWKIRPLRHTPITATLVWTDPIGNIVDPALDNAFKSLVNDLDIRITDDAGNWYYPWLLNPATPEASATTGDNIRDNVEKLVLNLPEERNYYVRVTHKGTLIQGPQAFSIVISYTPAPPLSGTEYYWVGGGGQWSDPSHWSLSSGGSPAGSIPGADDHVVVDLNSDVILGEIGLTESVTVKSLNWFAPNSWLNLHAHTLTIAEEAFLTGESLQVVDGTMLFSGNKTNQLVHLGTTLAQTSHVEFNTSNPSATWEILGTPYIEDLHLGNGTLNLDGEFITIRDLEVTGGPNAGLQISFAVLNGLRNLSLADGTLLTADAALISVDTEANLDFGSSAYAGEVYIPQESSATLRAESGIQKVSIDGRMITSGDLRIGELMANAGSELTLDANHLLTLTETTQLNGIEALPVKLNSTGLESSLTLEGYFKICFDWLIIDNIRLQGEAVVNAGENSVVTGSSGWVLGPCDEVLFVDFLHSWSCVNGATKFLSQSGGNITQTNWTLGPGLQAISGINSSTLYVTASTPGTYEVTLEISNGSQTQSLTRLIEFQSSPLSPVTIQFNDNQLTSSRTGDSYLWWFNGALLEGENSRSVDYQQGLFQVAVIIGGCNIISEPLLITSANREPEEVMEIEVYPNPNSGRVFLKVNHPGKVLIRDMLGAEVWTGKVMGEGWLEPDLAVGSYFLEYYDGIRTHRVRIIRKSED